VIPITGPNEAADRTTDSRTRLMARASAALFLGEGLLAFAAAVAGGGFHRRAAIVLAVSFAAGLLAAIVYFAYERLGRSGTHAVAAVGAVLIAIVVAVEQPSYGLLYVWLAFFIASFFRPRAVALHLGWILVCYGAAVAIGDPLGRPLEEWLLLAGTLVGASAFALAVRRHISELARRERESRVVLDTVFETAPVGLTLFDRELRYVRVNETFAAWSGQPTADHVGRSIDELFPGLGPQVEPQMQEILATGLPVVGIEATTGGRAYRSSRYPIRDRQGEITMIASIIDDVTDLTKAQTELAAGLTREQETRAFLDQLLEYAPIDFAYVDNDLIYRRINRRAIESTGRTADQILGHSVAEAYPEIAAQIEPELRAVLETGVPLVGQPLTTTAPDDGRCVDWLVSRFPLRNDRGEVIGVISMRTDVSELKRAEAQLAALLASEQEAHAAVEEARKIVAARNRELATQAATDGLTGLTNRAEFASRLEQALGRADESGRSVGILYVDLDNFKHVNDTFGHQAGDELLRTVATRLQTLARETDTVARIGGDEFVVLLPNLDPGRSAPIAISAANRIERAMEEPFTVGNQHTRVSASLGVGCYPADAEDAASLIAFADAAMYERKRLPQPRRHLRPAG
jgi:diguanylate cyclase (GGDEF)-like protein/PAS domain S-box-containing protein